VSDEGHAARSPLPVATLDDPQLQIAARHPRRVENLIAVAFVLGLLCMGAFGAAFWQNWRPWTLGLTLGGGMLFLGFGLISWGKYLMPRGPFVEERHPLASTEDERDAMSAAIIQRGTVVVRRRGVLGGLLAGGLGLFGLVAAFPLIRSLGPLPKKTLTLTNWKKHSLLVDSNGRPIHRDDLQPGGVVTVFPAGFENDEQTQAVDQTILIRAQTGNLVTEPGRASWAPEGYVAYSKLCTHLGCPVGLYEQELKLLVCPCHQSIFNILDGAVPKFGPAPRPLPQLPLYIDGSGYLRSQTGYDQPVGPGYWERTS
jgi:ubiquinol-cytochrome c reductase iron-sulfur subunit